MATGRLGEQVVVALSGGVDSAIAASLLLERGCQVTGAVLQLWTADSQGKGSLAGSEGSLARSKGSLTGSQGSQAVRQARRVADQLNIPLHVIDAREEFVACAVDYFIDEYAAGRTPNPCVECNRSVKFGLLLDRALALGASGLATGHYARVRQVQGEYQLLRGVDVDKDQSYFLHALSQAQLAQSLFPLGNLTKDQVRAFARQRGLSAAERAESHDICFLGGGDYRDLVAQRAPHLFRPGPIRDTAGRLVGQHRGLPAYTIGQRKGLGISAPEPLYVLAIDTAVNQLIVGRADELGGNQCTIERVHYVSGQPPQRSFRAQAKIRYRARLVDVTVTPLPDQRAHVRFDSVQRDITPGQFLVLYDGDVVLGGGAIGALPAARYSGGQQQSRRFDV